VRAERPGVQFTCPPPTILNKNMNENELAIEKQKLKLMEIRRNLETAQKKVAKLLHEATNEQVILEQMVESYNTQGN
jgi:hypothetical protein